MSSIQPLPAGVPASQGGAVSPYQAPVGGVEAPSEGLSPAEILRIVKQRKWTIIITSVLLLSAVAGGTYALYRYMPQYTAQGFVEVTPPPASAFELNPLPADPKRLELVVESEAQKMRQPVLLQQVLALPEVKNTQYYRSFDDDFAKCLNDLQSSVATGSIRNTYLIRVAFATRIPDEAELITQAIMDEHIKRSQVGQSTQAADKIRKLREQRTQLTAELARRRQDIANFRQQADVPALEAQREQISRQIGDLTATLTDLQTQVVDLETQLEGMTGRNYWELPITAEMRLRAEQDPILRFRREQGEAIELEILALTSSNVFGPEHRQIKLLEERKRQYLDAEAARREELYDDLRAQQTEFFEQSLARLRRTQAELESQRAEQQASQRDLDRRLQEFLGMAADVERLENRLNELDAGIREAEVTTNDAAAMRRLQVAQRAQSGLRPSFPNVRLFVAGGFLFAIGAGVGLALLLDLADKRVRTPHDVVRQAHVPMLGMVPSLDEEQADVDDIERAVRDAPYSLTAESFRQIRTNLLLRPGPEARTLLITSPGAECGKTSVAVNLAATLAHGGQRVLLIDGNLRRPTLRELFPSLSAAGLAEVLDGRSGWRDVVGQTDVNNLWAMSAGSIPRNPTELLSNTTMGTLLVEAAKEYDRIVIDGPPVLLMSDALILSVRTDGVVLVTRAASNTKGALKRASEQLARVGATVVGAVLNDVQARPGGYFRRQYREYYDYVGDEPPQLTSSGSSSNPDA